MRNQAVKHNVATFSELSGLLYAGGKGYKANTTSNSANLMSATMVDNLAEKVDERPLLFAYNWDCENCPLYGGVCCSGVA